MNAVDLYDITKTFGKNIAVDQLSLAVPKGCIYGFIGPNGSGKTTTLRMIMNILFPDQGNIKVLGEPLRRSLTQQIGYMPEERGMYKRMKVREYLKFFGGLKSGRNVTAEADKWLERLGLSDRANKKIETLSKGMTQKLQFIATVLTAPELIILDEPFAGLDPVNIEAIKDALLDIQARGTTIILSTHDMNMAEKICDFIFMIFNGQKVLDGTLESIQNQYGTDTLRIQIDNGKQILKNLTGIEKINNYGQIQELLLKAGTDPQTILKSLISQTRVKSFDTVKPSLHDIFVRIAAPKFEEVKHA
jgi:ABC-2 type transport system ATP-binding protein